MYLIVVYVLLLVSFCEGFDICSTHIDVMKYATSGALAGGSRALGRALSFPLDVMKTMEQKRDEEDDGSNKVGLVDVNAQLELQDYFRGVAPIVAAAVPGQALFLTCYNILNAVISCSVGASYVAAHPFLINLSSASIGFVPTALIRVPAELVKSQSQVSLAYQDKNFIFILRDIVSKKGFGGLYQGCQAQLIRDVGYNAFQMSFFQLFKSLIIESTTSTSKAMQALNTVNAAIVKTPLDANAFESPVIAGYIGIFAALCAAFLTHPADVIKTSMQTKTQSATETEQEMDLGQVINKIYNNQGWAGFYVGLGSRLALVSVGGFFFFFVDVFVEQQFR